MDDKGWKMDHGRWGMFWLWEIIEMAPGGLKLQQPRSHPGMNNMTETHNSGWVALQ
jgi:hypothetical protein